MKNNIPGLMVKDMKNKKKNHWTFFLCYPECVHKNVGKVLTAIEKVGLNVIGMRLMCGSTKFITTHSSRDGRNPSPGGDEPMEHLTPYPFIALILEGEGAISKALQLTSKTSVRKSFPFWVPGELYAYSSHSYESALEDYELWFSTDSDNWKEEVVESKYLACAFSDSASGPTDHVIETMSKADPFTSFAPNFIDNFYKEDLALVLIKPLAFQKQCVAKLVSIIEANVFSFRGLKLVRKSEVPYNDAWVANRSSSCEIKEDEYGIAMLADIKAKKMIKIVTNRDGSISTNNKTKKIEICSSLVYLGKPGDKNIIGAFFEFGAVSWVDPSICEACGGYFVATLSSLQFEE